jgi:L-fuculose-phosphate aldolase
MEVWKRMTGIIQKKREVIEWGCMAYNKGFLDGASGNLSLRLDDRQILITPSGISKGRLKPADLIRYDIVKEKPVGKGGNKPSSEIRMHTFIYRQRSDVQAILHAHPVYAVALSVAGISLDKAILPESVFALGTIVTCPYATPTTRDVVDVIKSAVVAGNQALILTRHGSITLGKTMEEAFMRLETLEHVAKVTAVASSIGKVTPLPKKEIQKIEYRISNKK